MHKTNNNIKKEKGNGGLGEQKKRQPKPVISAHKTDGLTLSRSICKYPCAWWGESLREKIYSNWRDM